MNIPKDHDTRSWKIKLGNILLISGLCFAWGHFITTPLLSHHKVLLGSLSITTMLLFTFEFSVLNACGWSVGNKYYDWLEQEGVKGFSINPFSQKHPILRLGDNGAAISTPIFSPLCKYYIMYNGPVFRWSKSHRLIKRYMQHAIEVDKIAQTIISDKDLFK